MDNKQLIRLDQDDKKRLNPFYENLNKGGVFSLPKIDIFKHDRLNKLESYDGIFLSSFDKNKIISSIPMHPLIFVQICPTCSCVRDIDSIKPFLDTDYVFPILLSPYNTYPSKFISEIIKNPHISSSELEVFRTLKIYENNRDNEGKVHIYCRHCLARLSSKYKVHAKYFSDLTDDEKERFRYFYINILRDLEPFLSTDAELLKLFFESFESRDIETLIQLLKIGSMVSQIRTSNIFKSPIPFNEDGIGHLQKYSADFAPETGVYNEIGYEDIILDGLGLKVPEFVDIPQYLEIVEPYRADIIKLTNGIINSQNDGNHYANMSEIIGRIGNINDKIRKAQKSKKYKILDLSSRLIKANSGMVFSIFVATALGLSGKMVGCSAAGVIGLTTKCLQGRVNFKIGESSEELLKVAKTYTEPVIHSIISQYTKLEIENVRLWSVREKLERLDNQQ